MDKKKQTPVPKGYELIRRKTRIRNGDLFLDVVDDPTGEWLLTMCAGSSVWHPDLIYCRKIATPKAPAKPIVFQPLEVVWTKKSPSIHPKSTKADLAKLLQETVDQLNDIGTKWAKARNTINALKKKAGK